MSIKKLIGRLLILALLLGGAYHFWYVKLNYRFAEVSQEDNPNKVYRSGLISPDNIDSFLEKGKIKTVINLLDASVNDKLNPAGKKHIDDEDKAIAQFNKEHNKSVQHINIPSRQIPTKKTLSEFFKVLDNKDNYPVLIHCYHGTGRAELYSALYRIEYEKMKNDDARKKTRMVVEGLGYTSSFGQGRKKGDFLINYKSRDKNDATIDRIK